METMEEEVQKAVLLFKQIEDGASSATNHIDNLLKKVKNGELNTTKGLSFLEMKYQTLLSYNINLLHILQMKTRGQSIEGDKTIERLAELRTVLEKIRPIDQKLKYQIDKLMKIVATGTAGSSDPLRFKANPDNFVSKISGENEGSESEEDEETEKKSNVYVPPKLAAVHYDGDETQADKKQRLLEKAKKRAASSAMLRDLRDQYSEAPEEVQESRDFNRKRASKRQQERTEYEEEHFTRLTVSKKERNAMKRFGAMSSLNNLTHFDDLSALTGEMDYLQQLESSKKKRKLTPGKGKKGKGKKGFKKKRK